MGFLKGFVVYALLAQTLGASPVQVPLLEEDSGAAKKRQLQGRFLHITDFHPDRFYKVYSSTADEYACHGGQGPAGIYGAETSDCDSPILLINKTMDWIEKELKDKIDFVIWTGDSARHDNDEELPRSEDQVVGLNKLMVEKLYETFGKHNGDEDDEDPNNDFVIPIIPNIGNNDILPHNIFTAGPNKWTRIYARVWRQFIPEAQKHQFEQGGWFFVEVIPNKLAVFSLNTLYFFTSNAAADGCAIHSEPGYRQMEWLRIQLQFMRERGVKAILTGHVPPIREDSKTTWDETCWQKYALWLRQYRDVIVSSHYGHFNYDHFILQDFEDLRKGTRKGKMPNYEIEAASEGDVRTAVSPSYFVDLRDAWSRLPKPPKSLSWLEFLMDMLASKKKKRREEEKYFDKVGGEFAERYAASFISASVVPNLYPSLRVFEYNITGLEKHNIYDGSANCPSTVVSVEEEPSADKPVEADKKKKKKKKKKPKYKFEIPEAPSKSSPPGPAYSPQTLSLVRFTQYLANLTHINNDFHGLSEDFGSVDASKWKEGKHKGKTKPKDHEPDPKKFKYEVHYDTKHDDVYQLDDLTIPNMVRLARRIGEYEPQDIVIGGGDFEQTRKKKKHDHKLPWFTFVRRAFVETLTTKEIEDEFG